MPQLIRDIVLARGIARFDILHEMLVDDGVIPDSDNLHYFKGVASLLTANGFNVFTPEFEFIGELNDCARELADYIKGLNRKVHVIGHSQGGLNTRHAIVDHGLADNVAMLTSVDTPHNGTSFADYALSNVGRLVKEMLRVVIDVDAFKDLTIASCQAFNQRAADAEAKNNVIYRTYSSFDEHDNVFLPLRPSWKIIFEREGANDGLVSVTSQNWIDNLVATDGTTKPIAHFSFPFGADHLNVCGWWDPAQHTDRSQYEEKVRDIYLQIANTGIA